MRLEVVPGDSLDRLLGGRDQPLPRTIQHGHWCIVGLGRVADRRENRYQPGVDFDLTVGCGGPEAKVMGVHEGEQVSDGPFLPVVELGQERFHARVVEQRGQPGHGGEVIKRIANRQRIANLFPTAHR